MVEPFLRAGLMSVRDVNLIGTQAAASLHALRSKQNGAYKGPIKGALFLPRAAGQNTPIV